MNNKKRNNHYVPVWYQKAFTNNGSLIKHLDLEDEIKVLPDKKTITIKSRPKEKAVKTIFCVRDLYTTFFGTFVIDEIEDKFFGNIDTKGSKAVKAFIDNDPEQIHKRFFDLYEFIDMQKLRTVKGLEWMNQNYNDIEHNDLLIEMQALGRINMSIWTNGVKEIVSSKNSDVKFIFSDHPVTTYNYSISPDDKDCSYPYDPAITLKATQTIFPLSMDECLILTNYEYADNSDTDPVEKITNPSYYKTGHVHTLNMIRERYLSEDDVIKINYIIKKRAKKYIGGAKKEWLYPEKYIKEDWKDFKNLLLPPNGKHLVFGGEMYIGYDSGVTEYQDAFGRQSPKRDYLYKSIDENSINPNNDCGCGSPKKYKDCCKGKSKEKRTSWKELSIRERNIIFFHKMIEILKIDKGKVWDDVRRELSPEQVKSIFQVFDDLWPLDTDIISLLPKEDNTLRVLYTGIVDADMIEKLVLNITLYFDEVIIQNPITHPSSMNKDYSPIHSPEKYLQHTLSYVYFMIRIFPFIENGTVNLIPSPSMFSEHLSLNSLNISKQRYSHAKAELYDEDNFTKEHLMEQHKRSLLNLSKEQALSIFRKGNKSDISDEDLYRGYQELAVNDMQALLQEDIFGNYGGQLQIMNFVPTFEMSMFISQLTGSIPITNSRIRWKEFSDHQHKELGIPSYNHQQLTNFLQTFNFTMSQDVEFVYENRGNKTIKKIRELFLELNNHISSPGSNKKFIKNFKSKFIANNKKQLEDFKDKDQYMYEAKLLFLIPNKGIINNNVRRLLIQSTSDKCSMDVPIAIFISI